MNDTPLPSALDAEGSVLCAIFDDASALVLDQVRTILDGPADFYSRANSLIYETICTLADEGQNPSPVSVAQRLNDNGKLKDVGGTTYIYETIALSIPAVVHVEQHALVVREKSRLRRMIAACKSIAAAAYGESGEGVQAFIEGAELTIGEIAHAGDISRLKPISKILQDVHAATNAASKVGAEIVGKATGFVDLDKLTSGLHDGDLRIVAGRPGMGKTSYALSEALGVARTGYAVPFFSLEMPELQLVYRLVALETRIPINNLRTGNLSTEEWKRFNEGIAMLSKMPIWIDDSASLSPAQLRSRTRRLMLEIGKGLHPHVTMGKVGVIYVDYLQLMTSPLAGQRFANREVEVSAISRELKKIAKVLNVPVTAMSQLNRAVESRADKRPLLSDLRESGSIEQDSDTVIFMYRAEYYLGAETPVDDKGVCEFIVAKQRNGATDTVKLKFDGPTTRFDNLEQRFNTDEFDNFAERG